MTLRRRAVAFAAIGALGFAVQLAAFAVLVRGAGLHYALASALAVEAAVLHNFLWHERWTWADRPAGSPGARLARLGGFHLSNGLVSIGGTLLFTVVFVEGAGLPPIAANAAALGATGVLNFVVSDRLVFSSRPPARAARRPAFGSAHARQQPAP